MNGERVHAAGQLTGKRLVDHTVALDPGLPFEDVSHDIDSEMGLPAGPMPGMAFMLVRFIHNLEALGAESLGQFIRDGIDGPHALRS
jgi:hypothetical protein